MRRDDYLSASKAGLCAHVQDIATKEIYASIPLDVGMTKGASILPYVTAGTELSFDKGVSLVVLPRRIGRLRSPEAFDTSANPDFRPSAMQQQALQMDHMFRTTRAALAREVAQAAASIRKMQQTAPVAAPIDPPVIEPVQEKKTDDPIA